MFFYIKVAPNGAPMGWFERDRPLEGYNTRTASAVNGKPFLLPAIRKGYEPFDPTTQVRAEPKLVASQDDGEIQYKVRDKTTAEIAAENEALAEGNVEADTIRKALVDTLLDLENRVRALEGQPAITRVQARTALKDRIKAHL